MGTPVEVDGASKPGDHGLQLVDRHAGAPARPTPDTCAYNDLALRAARPGRRGQGQPVGARSGAARPGVNTAGTQAGDTVYSPTATPRCAAASPRSRRSRARASATTASGWSTPSTPSPRASRATRAAAFLDASGKALGVLSTVAIAPLAGSNGVGDVAKEVAYMQAHGGPSASIVNGTEPFTGSLLGL